MTSTSVLPSDRKRGSDFAELTRWIKGAGLLDRRYVYYVLKIMLNTALFAGGAFMFIWLGDSWWQLLTAAFFALLFTQFAFMGHDAGHRQIFHSRRWNDLVGYAHGALTGISFNWWVSKHNRHHANPNHQDKDPDVDIPVLAFSQQQSFTKQGFSRWVTKYQAFLFFPLLLLEALMLRIASVEAVLRREVKYIKLEAVLLSVHIIGYLAAVFLVLSPGTAVLFIVVNQAVMGVYLGCSFAPNHKGMPMMGEHDKVDYLRKQVLTSRNVSGGRWVDFLLGGLNYQIEHHLFPNMPRANLRRAQVIVHDFCVQRGISYSQCGLLTSYGYVLRHLHSAGAPLRKAARAVS